MRSDVVVLKARNVATMDGPDAAGVAECDGRVAAVGEPEVLR
jgi:hypothetical protein